MPHSALPSIDSLDVAGKRVIVRCDLNVPLSHGSIADDLRIRATLPTLRSLLNRGALLAVCSHLGRPKGKVVDELRMAPVGERLGELLEHDVVCASDVAGSAARAACESDARITLLENLRFEPGEEANDRDFAGRLAALGEAYVNDAFGASHRAHASIVGLPERLPSAAGKLLIQEIDELSRLLEAPDHPYVAALGGAKVSDKLDVIGNLLPQVDAFCIGGAMAFTLLRARGIDVGRSLVEEDRIPDAEKMLEDAAAGGVEVHLPIDVVAVDSLDAGAARETVSLGDIAKRIGVDIGPRTTGTFAQAIIAARTVLWNGPMGIFEVDAYAQGTRGVAVAISEATREGAFTVAGGGDSAAALKKFKMIDAVSHLSTGGGASLEFLEGKELPGIAALRAASS